MTEPDSGDAIVCPCTGITEPQIKADLCRLHGSLDAVKKETGVATHCTGCLPAVLEIFDDVVQRSDGSAAARSRLPLLTRVWRKLKNFLTTNRYALFVVNTPLAQSKIACSNLSIDESGQSRGRVYFWGRLYNREGRLLRKFFFTLAPHHFKSIDVGELIQGTPAEGESFYGLIKLRMWGSAIVGSTRPYGYWKTSDALASTHDKYSATKDAGWQHTLVFVEISDDYDTDLILCNPLERPYSTRVWLLNDEGKRFDLGNVDIPALGSTLVCPLVINPASKEFLKGCRGSLLLENETQPIMSYYLGHDFVKNRWLIQHL